MHGIYFYGHNEPTLGFCLFEKIEGNQKEKKRTKKRKKKSKQRKKRRLLHLSCLWFLLFPFDEKIVGTKRPL